MDIEDLKFRVAATIDQWAKDQGSVPASVEVEPEPKKVVKEGQRAVRTKSTGDRVFLVDDVAKTKAWITSEKILTELGYEMGDVVEVDDKDLITYALAPSIYRVEA